MRARRLEGSAAGVGSARAAAEPGGWRRRSGGGELAGGDERQPWRPKRPAEAEPGRFPRLAAADAGRSRQPAKTADGDDVALKIDKPEDIAKQGGEEQNVQEADDGDGIKITDSSDIKFPNNVNPDAATISFKIKPDWSGGDQTDNALVELRGEHEWYNRLELVKNGEFLRFIVTADSGQEADISVRINDWQAGEPARRAGELR